MRWLAAAGAVLALAAPAFAGVKQPAGPWDQHVFAQGEWWRSTSLSEEVELLDWAAGVYAKRLEYARKHDLYPPRTSNTRERLRTMLDNVRSERDERIDYLEEQAAIQAALEAAQEAEAAAQAEASPSSPTTSSTSGWAIPWEIVDCESGGSWDAHNPSGADGPYQLMPEHWAAGGACADLDPASQSSHHECAARLWNGGSGASNWEQCLD